MCLPSTPATTTSEMTNKRTAWLSAPTMERRVMASDLPTQRTQADRSHDREQRVGRYVPGAGRPGPGERVLHWSGFGGRGRSRAMRSSDRTCTPWGPRPRTVAHCQPLTYRCDRPLGGRVPAPMTWTASVDGTGSIRVADHGVHHIAAVCHSEARLPPTDPGRKARHRHPSTNANYSSSRPSGRGLCEWRSSSGHALFHARSANVYLR